MPQHGSTRATPKERAGRFAARAALAYSLIAAAWIVGADVIVHAVLPDETVRSVELAKEAVFVVVSGTALLLFIRRFGREWERAESETEAAEDALRTSDRRYRSLVERVPGVVWLNEVDPADPTRTHCIYVGPQLEELLGYTPEEWMADNDLWQRVVVPDDLPAVLEENHLADAKGTLSMEYRARRRDGAVVWIHDEAVLIPAGDGRPAYWQGVMVDITAQRVQDVALHELTESLGGVFNASPLAIIVLEPDGRVRHWNPAAERIFGWTAAEIVGGPLPYVPTHKKEEFEQLMQRELAGGVLAGFETTRMRKDGSLVEVSLSVAALRDADGRVAGMLGVVEDISERRAVSEALATAEAKYRGLVERGPGVVYLTRPDAFPTEVTYVSPQVVDMLGYPAEAWSEDPTFWTTVVHPDDRDRVIAAAARSIESGEPLEIEYRFVAGDGREVWVHDNATVVVAPDGSPLVRQGLLVDVTGRRRAEEERQRAVDRQLRLATRLELLHQVDREVLSATSIDEMAGQALDHLRHLVAFDRGVVGLVDAGTGVFSSVAVRHSPAMGTVPPTRSHVPDAVEREHLSREVLLFRDLEDVDPDMAFVEAARSMGIRSLLSISLEADDGQLGALTLYALAPDAFDDEAIDIAREVGSELAIAIRQALLREALAERAEQLERLAQERQQMLHRIVRAQEEERERVALELHDGLGQVLTSISLFASDLEDELPPESRSRAIRVSELVRRAIGDSRQLVWSLRPPELERLGLVPALRRLAEEVSIPGLPVDLHEEIGDLRLAPESEAVVYRVVQEAVHNAQKHARGCAISILMRRRNGMLTTLVEDNGRGFDPETVPTGRGLGIVGMRERAELVDGDLVVESAIGAGTRIRLEVPIEGEVG